MTPLTHRLRASLLSGLFLLGALGMPLTDAALFHRAGHDPFAWVTHFEPVGATHHGDHCTLGLPQSPSQTAPLVNGTDLALRNPETHLAARPADQPRSTEPSALPRSRAPPRTV